MNEPKEWLARIAERLKALHDASDIPGKELAEMLGCAPSKVTRVRKGITEPEPEFVRAWAQATGRADLTSELLAVLNEAGTSRQEFRARMAAGQAPVQQIHTDLVEQAEVIRYFDMTWIPGLVQTREYARRVFEEIHDLHGTVDDIEDAVAVRMKRQQLLYDRSKRFEILVEEPALTRTNIDADIMVPQLHHLLTWLNASNVQLAVLPLRGKNRRTPQASFQMYDDLVIVEDFAGERERPTSTFSRAFGEMWAAAAAGKAARPLIQRAIEVWSTSAN